ncbi:MAG: NAD(P)-dependent oxidoreductase [Nitrospinaceae bacterium]|nr:NAD(P)-dependent oxidoreductase [Nitrospinaceae bacterium]MBT3820685.1 NAD(P)-dependent oxidoreductase [Nitrospinaceae bacterium]MBT4093337.1 NAD(P)-dependent oxidoreductase [Nitrospinaceae bacterium]MBT4430872.1 NAD(P)-dependent oxidoreductase [Nitrospinaceae bacterium]MBT5366408.1 NAD(P)-dependent oxidoreductase [Nitrospinaceae bacterium]
MEKNQTVGVIGLGNMGRPIAKEYIEAKTPLMVWDTSPKARKPFEKMKGAEVAEPGMMAEKCAVIIFVVPSSLEVAECLKGKNGILKNARKGLVLYDFTTSYPAETKKLARRAEKKGIAYLDAGMGRGTTRKLVLMIGGDQKAFRRSKRFLTPIVEKTFHLGELGSGHAMKLVHNMVLHTIFVSTCEGARIIERMGMKVEDMIDIFNTSVVYSYVSRHRFPNNILSGKWNANSRVFNLHKDVGMAVKLGKKHGAEVSLAENTFSFLGKAIKRGMREKDFSLLYRDFEQIRKVR